MKSKRYFDDVPTTVPESSSHADDLVEVNNEKTSKQRRFRRRKREPEVDAYPGDAPIDPAKLEMYAWGDKMEFKSINTNFAKKRFQNLQKRREFSIKQAARSEILLHEEAGYIEPDPGEFSYQISQREIANSVDITSATKYFDLNLEKYGPYRINYTRNGRHLLLGGKLGHVAAFDWQTKKLHCEFNVMEIVRDVQWLHVETMLAVAQKKWTFIYDNKGVELHCVKTIYDALRLEFLPFHFLLVACCGNSYIQWLDVSTGKMVNSFPTKEGRLNVMCQNPENAIICTGSAKGTVSMWSPNTKEPLVKVLCHPVVVRGVSVDNSGRYMATTGADRALRIWDVRTYKPLSSYRLPVGLTHVHFSDRKVLACSVGNTVQMFKDICDREIVTPYLVHDARSTITDLQFCPYEDVLGVGSQRGFTSLLVPGAGEPNFDALESNPYQSKKQRQEGEVKALLSKIQPTMISLDPTEIGRVDIDTLEEKLDKNRTILHLKPPKLDITVKEKRRRRDGKSVSERKKIVYDSQIREFRKAQELAKKEIAREDELSHSDKKLQKRPKAVLDRFKAKAV